MNCRHSKITTPQRSQTFPPVRVRASSSKEENANCCENHDQYDSNAFHAAGLLISDRLRFNDCLGLGVLFNEGTTFSSIGPFDFQVIAGRYVNDA